jgi:hypothetical protein
VEAKDGRHDDREAQFDERTQHADQERDIVTAISASSHPLPARKNCNDTSSCPFFSPHNIRIYTRVSRRRVEKTRPRTTLVRRLQ